MVRWWWLSAVSISSILYPSKSSFPSALSIDPIVVNRSHRSVNRSHRSTCGVWPFWLRQHADRRLSRHPSPELLQGYDTQQTRVRPSSVPATTVTEMPGPAVLDCSVHGMARPRRVSQASQGGRRTVTSLRRFTGRASSSPPRGLHQVLDLQQSLRLPTSCATQLTTTRNRLLYSVRFRNIFSNISCVTHARGIQAALLNRPTTLCHSGHSKSYRHPIIHLAQMCCTIA